MLPIHFVFFAIAIGIALFAGTLASIRQSLIRRPSSEFRPFAIALIHGFEWLLWIAALIALMAALPHPTTPVLVMVFFVSCVAAIQLGYREEARSLNRSLAMASTMNTSVVRLIESFADGCRTRLASQAKKCVMRMNRGEALVDAARRSRLPIDADVLAAISLPIPNDGKMNFVGIDSTDERLEHFEPSTVRQLAYVVTTIFLAWWLGWGIRASTERVFRAMTDEFSLYSSLDYDGMDVVVPLGNVIAILAVIWGVAVLVIRYLPLWMVRWVPWFGKNAINRWRCTAIRSIGHGTAAGHSPQEIFGLTARATRTRWIAKHCRVAATLSTEGVDLATAMRKSKLVSDQERVWLTAAQRSGNLPAALIQLANQIGRRERLRWRIRIAWLVPLMTVLVGIFVLAHTIYVFRFLAGMIGGLA